MAGAAPARARSRACLGGGRGPHSGAQRPHHPWQLRRQRASLNRFRLTLFRINRGDIALDRYQAHLPPAFAARLCGYALELMPPPQPRGGIIAAEDRTMRHAVTASLAPWCAAIAVERAAHAGRIAARSTQRAARAAAADGQTRAAHTNAASSPPAPRPVPILSCTGDSLPDRELAAHAAELRAPVNRSPQRAPAPGSTAPFKPFRIDPLNREPTATPGSTAPFKPSRIDPLNREPTAKPGSTAPFKPFRTDYLHLIPPRRHPSTARRAAALACCDAVAGPA